MELARLIPIKIAQIIQIHNRNLLLGTHTELTHTPKHHVFYQGNSV